LKFISPHEIVGADLYVIAGELFTSWEGRSRIGIELISKVYE
jgi:hypothetical protein